MAKMRNDQLRQSYIAAEPVRPFDPTLARLGSQRP